MDLYDPASQEALDNLGKAAHLKPNDPRLHVFFGLGYYRFAHYEKSEKEFELALKLDPNNSTACYNLGLAYMAQNKVDVAIIAFEKTFEINS